MGASSAGSLRQRPRSILSAARDTAFRAEVAVIGAGAAGLGVAAILSRRRVNAIVFERDDAVGRRWDRRYDRLHLHTIRRFSGLPYRPLPRTAPRYVSRAAYAEYLREYASALALDVRPNRRVEGVARADGEWAFLARGERWTARAVVIATGLHNEPRLPEWPGREGFVGRLLHSVDYRSALEFRGKRVLVVGIGNSGAEVAADLVEHDAAYVAIAVRTTPPITKREIFGIPVQWFGVALTPLPGKPVDRVSRFVRRLGVGDLRPYGLGDEAWGPFTERRPPMIDVGFLEHLKARRVTVRPDVARLTETGVVYADGRVEEFDVVIAATGYTTGLERLLGSTEAVDERGLPRGGADIGLFFAGYVETPRGQLFESRRRATHVASAVEEYLRSAR